MSDEQRNVRVRPWLSFRRTGGDDPRDFIPWERRHWLPYPSNGYFLMREEEFDPKTKSAVRYLTEPTEGAVTLTFNDLDAIFRISEEYDCTLMEATISHVGEDRFTKAFISEMLRAPKAYAKSASVELAESEGESVAFVDPRRPKKKARPPRKAKERQAEAG